MIKKVWLFLTGLIFSSATLLAGECISYTKNGNQVIFNCKDGSKMSLTINSSSVIKVWFDQSGKFLRSNESFAVINENLEDLGEINVNDEPACYEIFTSKLRIRVNKNPMQLQLSLIHI